jgi:hypothetical protein
MVKFLSMALSKGGDSNGKEESSQEVRQEKEEVSRPVSELSRGPVMKSRS